MAELSSLERAVALAEGYDSFFALCRKQNPSTSYGRYAGVATFVRTAFRPHRAEEGVTGVLSPNSASNEAAGSSFASMLASFPGAAAEPTDSAIDSEGRCVITIHGDLAILNVYVPANSSDDPARQEERLAFKAAFLRALERRARSLLAEGLRVLIIGDFNIAPNRIDSARELQAQQPSGATRSRVWLDELLHPRNNANGGPPRTPFADCFRMLHPTAREAYTCFHVAAGADAFNFGSRIDLALLAPPPIVSGTAEDAASRAAASSIEQFAFGSSTAGAPAADAAAEDEPFYCDDDDGDPFSVGPTAPSKRPRGLPSTYSSSSNLSLLECSIMKDLDQSDHKPLRLVVSGLSLPPEPPPQPSLSSAIRLGGQSLLSSFVSRGRAEGEAAPAAATAATAYASTAIAFSAPLAAAAAPRAPRALTQSRLGGFQPAAAKPDATSSSGGASSASGGGAAAGWHALFQKANDRIPLCRHKEPCKKQTVRKAGPNQGKCFFSCQRAEGPRANPETNCGYFKWASDWANELAAKRKREGG